jgi:hypothetical protein
VIDEDIGERRVWKIVGEPETDAKSGAISITSSLARALIGNRRPSAREPRRNRQPALGLHALSREPPTGSTAGLHDQVRQLISPL